jgi:hypothetical protein
VTGAKSVQTLASRRTSDRLPMCGGPTSPRWRLAIDIALEALGPVGEITSPTFAREISEAAEILARDASRTR